MAVLNVTKNISTHPLGWVKTALQDGDELGAFPGHSVPALHDLAALYGISAKEIVEGNGVVFDADPIDRWVLDTGGKQLSNGQPVFAKTSVIWLPPNGPRPRAGSRSTAVVKKSTSVWWWVGAGTVLAGAIGYAAWAGKKGKKRHASTVP